MSDADEALLRSTSRMRLAAPKRRTCGLLGRLTAEQKARAYSYDGNMKCGVEAHNFTESLAHSHRARAALAKYRGETQ